VKVTVDPDKCCGYGECAAVAPELFRLGDDNRSHVLADGELSGREVTLAHEASYSCPFEAIQVTP
jgi:ferredoxin